MIVFVRVAQMTNDNIFLDCNMKDNKMRNVEIHNDILVIYCQVQR